MDLETSDIFKHLAARAKDYGYMQVSVSEDTVLWQDVSSGNNECMVCIVKDAMVLDNIHSIFDNIKKYSPTFTYAVVHQIKDGEGVYDIFRFSRFSFLEHNNRVYSPKRGSRS